MTINEYVENIAIPALNEEKEKGFTRSAICVGYKFDSLKFANEIEKRTNFTCTPCGGTIYIKLF